MSKFARGAIVVMAVLFAVSVLLQYNDPDPIVWMLLYGAAYTACVQALRRRLPNWLAPSIGAVALVWAASLAPSVIGHVRVAQLFQEIPMGSTAIEQGREMGGLLIVAVTMAGLARWDSRRRTAERPVADGRPDGSGPIVAVE